ncbi:transposase, partial [Desulfothermus okinawensis]
MNKDTLNNLLDELIQNLISGKLSSQDFYEKIKLSVVPLILNTIMKEERNIYLKENTEEYANGFYPRTLYLNNTPLKVNIPRTRTSSFFPSSIPKYSRYLPQEYSHIVESLFLSTSSIEALKA